ncbi:Uncharacterised protein [Vibrio cholerae]|nr:Uncharacterised protein [Vibrio cholerae]
MTIHSISKPSRKAFVLHGNNMDKVICYSALTMVFPNVMRKMAISTQSIA